MRRYDSRSWTMRSHSFAPIQLNGYFTITEYPVVRKTGDGSFRTLTEIDVAAVHLPNGESDFEPDGS